MSESLPREIRNQLDALLDHLSSSWKAYSKFYLDTLIPTQIQDPSKAMEGTEKRVFEELRRLLTPEQQANISRLVEQRRVERLDEVAERRRIVEEERLAEEKRIAAEAREREIKAKEEERIRLEHEELRLKFIAQFKADFLNADAYFHKTLFGKYSENKYRKAKAEFVQEWCKIDLKIDLDLQQAAAVSTVNGHIKVTARAGSGKTTTLISRALFLQKYCGVKPSEILLLAFNQKAAAEIRKRLTSTTKGPIPYAMTFHALAWAVLHPDSKLIADSSNGENHSYSRVIQEIINDHLQTQEGEAQIKDLMLSHFRFNEDWEKVVSGGYLKAGETTRIQYARESLRGEYLKSFGEKVIADFLFEHDIPYIYEKSYLWDNRTYRPDFTIYRKKQENIVIEYFGMLGDPDYEKNSQEKRTFWEHREFSKFLEYTPKDIKLDGVEAFKARLKADLEEILGPITRLSDDEIWNRVEKRAKYRFTSVAGSFIGKCRKSMLTPEALAKKTAEHTTCLDVESKFLKIVGKLYQSYLDRLKATGEEDFDGLMARAAEAISSGTTAFYRKSENGDLKNIRYVLIDEFQDFSRLFLNITNAIRSRNTTAQFFCVGDDWQAINGFAGSDLEFFGNFDKYFSPAQSLSISTNYRSGKDIVESGNELMDGLGDPAIAHNLHRPGQVLLADISRFVPTVFENVRHPYDIHTPALLRLIKTAVDVNKEVVLLFRTNTCPWHVTSDKKWWSGHIDISEYADLLRSFFPKDKHGYISVATVHKYKGLEKHFVILPDCTISRYPLIHPDWIFNRVLGETAEGITQEEKRLFYVAMTRSISDLIMITDGSLESPFLSGIANKSEVQNLEWSNYKPLLDSHKRWNVIIVHQEGATAASTIAIKAHLPASGYKFQSGDLKRWEKHVSPTLFTFESLNSEPWVALADKVEVRILEDSDKLKIKCHVDNGQLRVVYGKFETMEGPQ